MRNSEELRLARCEAVARMQKSEMQDSLESALQVAIAQQDEEAASEIIRKIRNRLLALTDQRVALDRLDLSTPSGTSFSAWIDFLRGLVHAITGSWAQYRQALRDLPMQPGFPFNVEWPIEPDDE